MSMRGKLFNVSLLAAALVFTTGAGLAASLPQRQGARKAEPAATPTPALK